MRARTPKFPFYNISTLITNVALIFLIFSPSLVNASKFSLFSPYTHVAPTKQLLITVRSFLKFYREFYNIIGKKFFTNPKIFLTI